MKQRIPVVFTLVLFCALKASAADAQAFSDFSDGSTKPFQPGDGLSVVVDPFEQIGLD